MAEVSRINLNLFDAGGDEIAESKWLEGFTTPISDVEELLGVSKSWITQNLLNHINSVVYPNKWIWSKTKTKCLTYINKDELSKWIIDNATFEKQTEYVDLSYYLAPYRDIEYEARKIYKEQKEAYKTRGFRKGTVPEKVLDYINDNLVAHNMEHNYSCMKRSEVLWQKVEPFDIFKGKSIYNCKDKYHRGTSRETIYRNAFLNGDIRVKLGEQITIFVRSKQNISKMKMPYLVPYNKTLMIVGRK